MGMRTEGSTGCYFSGKNAHVLAGKKWVLPEGNEVFSAKSPAKIDEQMPILHIGNMLLMKVAQGRSTVRISL
ncbi:hypothetical protein EB241_01785 [Erwinia psidii]|uniref:Uncharacterized protein n=1 Tax=Erwinia psidii TaxID=69224 RepID=A0A3N6TXQ4_9GAMM|nr:hypothetical protein EB241_01785 [Erwinia psidii]